MQVTSRDPRCSHTIEIPDGPPGPDEPPHEGHCGECGLWYSADVRVRPTIDPDTGEETGSEAYLHSFAFKPQEDS